jgi:integrase/recombinase XerD
VFDGKRDPTLADWLRTLQAWDHALAGRGIADSTRRTYRYYVLRFHADTCLSPMRVGVDDVTAYVAAQNGRGVSKGTIIKALRSYFGYLHERGDIAVNPAAELRVRKKKYLAPRALSEFELKRLEAAAFERDPRHGWAMRLMYATGARVESMSEVRPEDVDLRDSTIAFRTAKGDKPYRVPLGNVGLEAAQQLLALHEPARGPTLLGVKPGTLWWWVSEAAKQSGVKASPHVLRHSFATHLRQKGADVEVVRTLLNHKSLAVTQRYFEATEDEARAAVNLL